MRSKSLKSMGFQVTNSIYDMVGAESETRYRTERVERIFCRMDSDCDGMISRTEFLEYCHQTNRSAEIIFVLSYLGDASSKLIVQDLQ